MWRCCCPTSDDETKGISAPLAPTASQKRDGDDKQNYSSTEQTRQLVQGPNTGIDPLSANSSVEIASNRSVTTTTINPLLVPVDPSLTAAAQQTSTASASATTTTTLQGEDSTQEATRFQKDLGGEREIIQSVLSLFKTSPTADSPQTLITAFGSFYIYAPNMAPPLEGAIKRTTGSAHFRPSRSGYDATRLYYQLGDHVDNSALPYAQVFAKKLEEIIGAKEPFSYILLKTRDPNKTIAPKRDRILVFRIIRGEGNCFTYGFSLPRKENPNGSVASGSTLVKSTQGRESGHENPDD